MMIESPSGRWEPTLLHLFMSLTLSTTGPKVQCQIEQRAYIRLFAMRDKPGLRQAGIEIGHWDNVVRRRFAK